MALGGDGFGDGGRCGFLRDADGIGDDGVLGAPHADGPDVEHVVIPNNHFTFEVRLGRGLGFGGDEGADFVLGDGLAHGVEKPMVGGVFDLHGEIGLSRFAIDAEKVLLVHVAPWMLLDFSFVLALFIGEAVDGTGVDVSDNAIQAHAMDDSLAGEGVARLTHFSRSVHVRIQIDGHDFRTVDIAPKHGDKLGDCQHG